jgi:transposase-like protein
MPTCPHCQSLTVVKNGHDRHGSQTYRCNDCHRRFQLTRTRPVHTDAFRNTVVAALNDRMSARGAARVFGIHRDTARAWLKKRPTGSSRNPSKP